MAEKPEDFLNNDMFYNIKVGSAAPNSIDPNSDDDMLPSWEEGVKGGE